MSSTVTNNSPIRIAVIGAGTISQSIHIPTILRAGFELVSVCDLSPSRVAEVAERSGVVGTTSPEQVFADPNVDAVLIATPGSHAQLTKAALAAGKHVLAEKPLALTLAEVDELEKLASAAKRVLQIGYMKMYDPLTERARTQLEGLSDVRLVRITVAHPDDLPQIDHLRMDPPKPDADMNLIAQANAYEYEQSKLALEGAPDEILSYYRNVLNGSVVHELSLLRALGLELPTSWNAEAFPKLGGSAPASLLATASVGDVRYILSWNWLPEYPEYEEELKVFASNGRLEYKLGKPYLLEERSTLRVETHEGLERQNTTYTQTYETGFLRQLDAFAESIQNGAPVVADLAGARRDIVSLQALAQAIARTAGVAVVTESERS